MKEVKLLSQIVVGQHIEIGHKDQRFASSIVNAEIQDSKITLIGKGRGLTLIDSAFDSCVVIGKSAYGYFLDSASWINSKFEGRFSDCVFGFGLDLETMEDIPTKIEGCDFSKAKMDIVAFRRGLVYSTCKWPSFPHVLVLSDEIPKNIKESSLPPEFLCYLRICTHPKSNHTAVVYDLTRFDKDLERIYSVLFEVPGFHFFGDSIPSTPNDELVKKSQSHYEHHKMLYAKYSLWSFISQSVSITSILRVADTVTLDLKASNSPHVPVPNRFLVRLRGVSRFDLAAADFLIEEKNKKSFRIMGAKTSDDYEYVMLKGHRKTLGNIGLAYDTAEFLDQDGNLIDIEVLNEWQNN